MTLVRARLFRGMGWALASTGTGSGTDRGRTAGVGRPERCRGKRGVPRGTLAKPGHDQPPQVAGSDVLIACLSTQNGACR